MAKYDEWLTQAGIRPEVYAGYSDDEKNALLGSYNQNVEQLATTGNDFWSMKGGGGLALGGLQTGIGLMGTLDAMKTAGLQRKLLGQQYDTNAEKMANWRSNTANVKNAFGGGLAAGGVTV